MTAIWLLVTVFATWRLTSLVSRERGPFAIGVRVRSLFGVFHEPDGSPSRDEDGDLRLNPVTPFRTVDALLHEIGLGLTCMWCCSVWVSMALAFLLREVAPEIVLGTGSYLLVVLALSGGAILMEALRERTGS